MEKIIGISNINNEIDNFIRFKEIEIEPKKTYTIIITPISRLIYNISEKIKGKSYLNRLNENVNATFYKFKDGCS